MGVLRLGCVRACLSLSLLFIVCVTEARYYKSQLASVYGNNGYKAEKRYVKVFNVLDYGADPYGKRDNSQAFLKAWNEACESETNSRVWIPKGTYLLNPVMFVGPCNGRMTFKINGILKGPTDKSLIFGDSWINFRYIDRLAVSGGGTLDGQGAAAWKYNDCSTNSNCSPLLTTMRFDFVTNAKVHHLRSINSKNNHIMLFACEYMNIHNIRIYAPADSPNTDGIKMGNSRHIKIWQSTVQTGDDCVAIISGSRDIHVTGLFCGPGHGISVGSLGKSTQNEQVQDVYVKNCTLSGTPDGLRIKTWSTSNVGLASNLNFEDIVMKDVQTPINIDQNYCPHPPCPQEGKSNIQISHVRFKNIRGSCSSDIAVNVKCSKSKPCKDVGMENIKLWRTYTKEPVRSMCSNVLSGSQGQQIPPSCF